MSTDALNFEAIRKSSLFFFQQQSRLTLFKLIIQTYNLLIISQLLCNMIVLNFRYIAITI